MMPSPLLVQAQLNITNCGVTEHTDPACWGGTAARTPPPPASPPASAASSWWWETRWECAFLPLPAASQSELLTGGRARRLCAPAGVWRGAGRTTPAASAPLPSLQWHRRESVLTEVCHSSSDGTMGGGARPPTVLAVPQVPLQLYALPLHLLQTLVQVSHLHQEALRGQAGVCLHLRWWNKETSSQKQVKIHRVKLHVYYKDNKQLVLFADSWEMSLLFCWTCICNHKVVSSNHKYFITVIKSNFEVFLFYWSLWFYKICTKIVC